MSLSKFLHNPQYIRKVAETDLPTGRKLFEDLAIQYVNEHEDYYFLMERNLSYFGLPSDKGAVESAVKHIGLHYHEKFLSFGKPPSFYPDFHKRIQKSDDVIAEILQRQKEQKACIILSTHFGGMALIPGVLNSCKMELSSIIRFPSEEFKQLIMSKHEHVIEALGYGRTKFFEVDKQPIMELAFGLKDGETFFSVLDEHTPFSVEVSFLGKTIFGGAGIDKIIDFIGPDEVNLYFTVMPRVEESYRLDIHRVDLSRDNYVQDMFDLYAKYVSEQFEQWFFLQEVHENMPEHS